MGVNYSTIVAVVTASSAVSALCSVLFILTYRYDSVWYEKPENFKDVKTLLCFLSGCMLVECVIAVVINKPKSDWECYGQGVLLMGSLTAAFLYEAAAMLEMVRKIYECGGWLPSKNWYHVLIWGYVIGIAVWACIGGYINSTSGGEDSANVHCHYAFGTTWLSGFMFFTVFIPAIMSCVTIIIAGFSIYGWHLSGGLERSDTLNDTERALLRMLLTPLLYFMVFCVCAGLIWFGNTFESEVLALALVKVVPAFNTILWIWTDTGAVKRWRMRLSGLEVETESTINLSDISSHT